MSAQDLTGSRPRARRRGVAAVLVALGLAAAIGCSLGLDESKIGPSPTGDAANAPNDDGASPAEAASPVDAGGLACTTDAECAPLGGGCRTPRCDVPRGTCVVDVCRTAACSYGRCGADQATCGAAASHGLLAGTVTLGQATACGAGSLRNCVAAVHPFLFVVGERGEVLAVRANDPGKGAPEVTRLEGVGFPAVVLVRKGRSLVVYGARYADPVASQQLAVLDVPLDPYAPLVARPVLVQVPFGLGGILPMHGAEGQLWLQGDPSGQAGIFAADAGALPARVLASPLNGAVGGLAVGVSERRLIVQSTTADGRVSFGTITNAGAGPGEATALAQVNELNGTGPQQVRVPDDVSGQVRVVSNLVTYGDAGAGPSRGVRHAFVGLDARSQLVAEVVDVETYPAPVAAATPVLGPVAVVDRDTSLVVHGVLDGATLRAAATLVKRPGQGAPKRVILPGTLALDRAVAAADAELAWVVSPVAGADGGPPADTSVNVLDLPCAP